MNYIYAIIYLVVCFTIFIFIFLPDKAIAFFFEKKFNNITDVNDLNFTGGIEYIFNPFHHFKQ